jgi:uncharacterized protein
VSKQLPSREQALEILRQNHCPTKVIEHCQAVASLALELAGKLVTKNLKVNLQLVLAGALLHDLGRCKTHSVDHAVVGAQIAEVSGLPDEVVCIIKRHVGAGITSEEALWLGWPKDIYVPLTLEEKIVSYADKLIDGSERFPINAELEKLKSESKFDAAERVKHLHEEMMSLLGET